MPTRSEIAKKIRADIKLHVETGDLPEGRYVVRTEEDKIRVTIETVALSPLHEKHGRFTRYTAAANELLSKLESLAAAHQATEPDPVTGEPVLNFRCVVQYASHLKDAELGRT